MVHDLRDLLAESGNPKEGYIFVTQTKAKRTRAKANRDKTHNEAMKALAEKAFGKDSEKAKDIQDKNAKKSL